MTKNSYTIGVAGSSIVTTTNCARAARVANALADQGHTVDVHRTSTVLVGVARRGRPIDCRKLSK